MDLHDVPVALWPERVKGILTPTMWLEANRGEWGRRLRDAQRLGEEGYSCESYRTSLSVTVNGGCTAN